MTDKAKRKALIYYLLAVMMVMLIAAGLPGMQLTSGIPLPEPPKLELTPIQPLPNLEESQNKSPTDTTPPAEISAITLARAILGVILTFTILFVIYKIRRKVRWQDGMTRLLVMIILAVVGLLLLFSLFGISAETLPTALSVFGPSLGAPPSFLIWLILIGLVLLTIPLAVWIKGWRTKPAAAGDGLIEEAERALRALKMGKDFKNVIIECYWQMGEVLQKERGIQRAQAMTPREFERLLEKRGISHSPVHQLTELFEAARYGIQAPDPQDEQKAFECLNAIIHSVSSRSPEQAV